MEDIREVLEMFDPMADGVIDDLVDYTNYIVVLKAVKGSKGVNPKKEALLRVEFRRYNTVPPKFVCPGNSPRYTAQEIKYILKLK